MYQYAKSLYRIQDEFSEDILRDIFPEISGYLWDKFSRTFGGNLLEFFNYLSDHNRRRLCEWMIDGLERKQRDGDHI
jgi:hypothetical protein